jgi:hypothetical protein|tara:strand:+ start:967 stop:1146 length:180 start_codon:yes stop_codon:yes gene_type:complete
MDKGSLEFFIFLIQVGNDAVYNAKQENKKYGLPNVYANDKGLYFELPDGTITTKNPLTE